MSEPIEGQGKVSKEEISPSAQEKSNEQKQIKNTIFNKNFTRGGNKMIDTVKFSTPTYYIQSIDISQFQTKCQRLHDIKYSKSLQSQKPGLYYPQVYIRQAKEFHTQVLDIELSISKFMKGENLLSFRQDIKEAFFNRLITVLELMGIQIPIEALENSKLSKIHPCINLIINTPTNLVIEDLSHAYITKTDIKNCDFPNNGSIVHFHNQFKEFALYDKTLDMEQAERKAKQYFDGTNWKQPPFLYADYLKGLNIIRFEPRFNSRQEIRKAFGKDMTLGEVFDDTLIRNVLLSSWKIIENGMERLPKANMELSDVSNAIKKSNPNMRGTKVAEMAYVATLLLTKGYKKTYSQLISDHYNKADVSRLIREAINLDLPKYKPDYLAQITEGIKAFKPLDINTLIEAKNGYISSLDPNFNLHGFLTVEEIAYKLKCTTRHIQKELKEGRLIGYKIGKLWRAREKALSYYLGEHNTKNYMKLTEDKTDENK